MVAIGLNGVALPKTRRFPTLELDLAGLEVLAALSSGAHVIDDLASEIASRCGASEASILALAADLQARGLLLETDPHRPTPPEADLSVADVAAAATIDDDHVYVLSVPTVLRIHAGAFEHRWHDGTLALALSPSELIAASSWREPSSPDDAFDRFALEQHDEAPDRSAFDAVARRLLITGLLVRFDAASQDNDTRQAAAEAMRESIRRNMRINHAIDVDVEAHLAEVAQQPDGGRRVPVIPMNHNWHLPPLSLGLIVAYAKAYDDGALERSFDFVPKWVVNSDQVPGLTTKPGIFLFSNYIWTHGINLGFSAQVKELSPNSLTVHGGPDTPKYEADLKRYFRDNPHVDITVRGEGEVTFAEMLAALAGQVGDGPPDLSVLADVPGLTFRLGDRLVTTADRDRIADLNTIPSPFLTGLFDSFTAGPARGAMLETNRGCPYGCTFCDWGSATLSRIRQFDLDRVMAEIEWCARHGFGSISLCDSNFGIFERDVAIAEKFAEMRTHYGYPEYVGNNYAKNTVKHLKKIIKVFADVGILAEGVVSLQSMDTQTLQVIRRKNIKVEKYTDLASEFGANRLPLAVDIMMALPGSTIDSYVNDLQQCANRDVRTRIHPTTMLPNSPMNEPSYRAEHGLVALPGEVVKRSNTFDEDDWDYMWDLRQVFLLCDLYAALRQVARFVRSETGMKEVAFYDRIMRDAFSEPDRWPTITFAFQATPYLMVPPGSWSCFLDEVRDYLTSVLGVVDDTSLDTVLAVQLAHLPARDRRQFPQVLNLTHDYAEWHRARVAEHDAGHLDDWEQRVPALRTYGPATMTIDDPENLCTIAMGGDTDRLSIEFLAWDLESPVARPRPARGELQDEAEPASERAPIISAEPAPEPMSAGTPVALATSATVAEPAMDATTEPA